MMMRRALQRARMRSKSARAHHHHQTSFVIRENMCTYGTNTFSTSLLQGVPTSFEMYLFSAFPGTGCPDKFWRVCKGCANKFWNVQLSYTGCCNKFWHVNLRYTGCPDKF